MRVEGALVGMQVVHVALGKEHSVCITAPGYLWTWGKGTKVSPSTVPLAYKFMLLNLRGP